jgi:hypothetical protein
MFLCVHHSSTISELVTTWKSYKKCPQDCSCSTCEKWSECYMTVNQRFGIVWYMCCIITKYCFFTSPLIYRNVRFVWSQSFLSRSVLYRCVLKYVVCPKSKCTDFLFKCLWYSPEITSYLLESMTLGKLHNGSNSFSTDNSSTRSHFP